MESNECCQHLELFEAECERYHNLIDEKDESLKKALAKIKTYVFIGFSKFFTEISHNIRNIYILSDGIPENGFVFLFRAIF